LVRTGGELAAVVKRNPFASKKADPRAIHVAFLDARPPAAKVKALPDAYSGPEEFHVVGRDVFLYYPNGYGRTKLTNNLLEKVLGVAATSRNWNTVTKLAEMAAD